MKRKMMMEIDKVRLINEIGRRGMTMSEASREMGMSRTFLQMAANRGTISESTMVMLNKLWNIKYEDIRPIRQEEQQPAAPAAATPDLAFRMIEEAMYRALVRYGMEEKIYKAMKRALND